MSTPAVEAARTPRRSHVDTAANRRTLEAAFDRCLRYRERSWQGKVARHPVREAVRAAYGALSWLAPREVTATLFTRERLAIVLPELSGLDLYRHGCIEPDLTALVLRTLQRGMTFVDVGAHHGYYASLAKRLVGPEGVVLAFEPGRQAFSLLSRNMSHHRNIRLENMAAGATNGTAVLRDFGPRHSALNTLKTQARVPSRERDQLGARTYEVPCVRLDDYLAGHGLRPDFIKIDAEGSELDVLRGMEETLKETEGLVSVEVGDYDDGPSMSRECIAFMARLGLSCFESRQGALIRHCVQRSYGYGNLCFGRA
jgi:FkbM family methyltransferase